MIRYMPNVDVSVPTHDALEIIASAKERLLDEFGWGAEAHGPLGWLQHASWRLVGIAREDR